MLLFQSVVTADQTAHQELVIFGQVAAAALDGMKLAVKAVKVVGVGVLAVRPV
jgi:hypothetical protein